MFFIGIVRQRDADRGCFNPTYVLFQSHGISENRTGWRVLKLPGKYADMRKVLVAAPCGHENMIAFLSHYRTRDHMHGSKKYRHEYTKKYYPKGFLCWFECDQFGQQTGRAIIIKRVPDHSDVKTDAGMEILKQDQGAPALWERFSRDCTATNLQESGVKPVLYQERVPKRGAAAVTLK